LGEHTGHGRNTRPVSAADATLRGLVPRNLRSMTSSRHRREVSRRTSVLGSLLAFCLACGVVALGLAEGSALRLAMMFILGVAVAAGLLALDEARVVEARVQAELSRERAARARDGAAHAEALRALVGRIDQLEGDVVSLRREQRRAPRSIVIVAQGAHAPASQASRILQIADVVPAVRAVFEPQDDGARVVDVTAEVATGPQSPPTQAPELIDLRASIDEPTLDVEAGAGADETIDLDLDDFPVIEVVGEFSLEGLALFPRPAGMPTAFPSVDAGAESEPEPVDPTAEGMSTDEAVIDLRERQRTHRSA
jgi:hypothetical protein